MTEMPAAIRYDVQVATNAGFTNLIQNESGLQAQSLEVGSLAKGTTYHWRIRAQNASGPGSWAVSAFTTSDRAPRRYYVKDHLGSIRAVVDPDAPLTETGSETDKVVETCDYYPFGLRMPGRSGTPGTETAEDYTGHELDVETGMHYAGARYYMSALGRWNGPDPILEEVESLSLLDGDRRFLTQSPYNYTFGNPVVLKDPDGKCPLPNVCAGAIGAVVGGVAGAGVEAYQQYANGESLDGGAIIGAGVQGAVVGGTAGLTGGASLAGSVGAGAVSNVVGGIAGRAADRAVSEEETELSAKEELSNIGRDAVSGALGGGIGKLIGPNVDDAAKAIGIGGDSAGEALVRTGVSEGLETPSGLAVEGVIDGATSAHSEVSIREDFRRMYGENEQNE